ncbi:hypothetical protein NVP1101O_224 [Vibrio phage 1.101.O._10N.261.45.C6]|nr:hypothetical protein NVP1101O_224 [Vibrio phage 1.101.O._10N.261.45.C6]
MCLVTNKGIRVYHESDDSVCVFKPLGLESTKSCHRVTNNNIVGIDGTW